MLRFEGVFLIVRVGPYKRKISLDNDFIVWKWWSYLMQAQYSTSHLQAHTHTACRAKYLACSYTTRSHIMLADIYQPAC